MLISCFTRSNIPHVLQRDTQWIFFTASLCRISFLRPGTITQSEEKIAWQRRRLVTSKLVFETADLTSYTLRLPKTRLFNSKTKILYFPQNLDVQVSINSHRGVA